MVVFDDVNVVVVVCDVDISVHSASEVSVAGTEIYSETGSQLLISVKQLSESTSLVNETRGL